jgi:hypothetical protein
MTLRTPKGDWGSTPFTCQPLFRIIRLIRNGAVQAFADEPLSCSVL